MSRVHSGHFLSRRPVCHHAPPPRNERREERKSQPTKTAVRQKVQIEKAMQAVTFVTERERNSCWLLVERIE